MSKITTIHQSVTGQRRRLKNEIRNPNLLYIETSQSAGNDLVGHSCDNEFEVDKGLTDLLLRMGKRVRKRDLIIKSLKMITGVALKKGKKAAPRFEVGMES